MYVINETLRLKVKLLPHQKTLDPPRLYPWKSENPGLRIPFRKPVATLCPYPRLSSAIHPLFTVSLCLYFHLGCSPLITECPKKSVGLFAVWQWSLTLCIFPFVLLIWFTSEQQNIIVWMNKIRHATKCRAISVTFIHNKSNVLVYTILLHNLFK